MKIKIAVIVLLFSSLSMWAQDINEVFSSSKTTMEFVGLDFSQAKMVGTEGFRDPGKIQGYYFGALNGLFMSEMNKYDVKRAFKKSDMDYDFAVVEPGNDEVDFMDMVTNKLPKSFSDERVQSIVNKYDTKGMQAKYGLSFIVHSFNKYQERAYIYVVIFDAKSKKVLFSNKMSGEAGGFGFRNYWARTVYNILEDIKDYKFRKWKKALLKAQKAAS